jgi:hypothetical protein
VEDVNYRTLRYFIKSIVRNFILFLLYFFPQKVSKPACRQAGLRSLESRLNCLVHNWERRGGEQNEGMVGLSQLLPKGEQLGGASNKN